METYRVWDKRRKIMSKVSEINFGDDGEGSTIVIIPAPRPNPHYILVDGEDGVLMMKTPFKDVNKNDIYVGDNFYDGSVCHLIDGRFIKIWINGDYEDLMPDSSDEIFGHIYENIGQK